jgi:purine nucleoside permease
VRSQVETTSPVAAARQRPIPIKVVVVTMFEIGEDTGDRPGEFQTWVEQLPLPDKIPFPQGSRDLRYNPDQQVLGIVTGVGTARAAASIMALGRTRALICGGRTGSSLESPVSIRTRRPSARL